MPRWLRVIPYFLSALLFMSGFFTAFSPTPLLVLAFFQHPALALLAMISNSLLIYFAGGPTSLAFYLVFVVTLSLGLSAGIRRKLSVERLVLATLAFMGGVAIAWLSLQALERGNSLWQECSIQAGRLADYVLASLTPEARESWLEGQTPEEWRRAFIAELPSVGLVSAFVMILANLLIVLRLNPAGIRERLGLTAGWYRQWKSPEWLVFPAIATGAVLVFEDRITLPWLVDLGRNGIKLFVAIYALQGLSILSAIFEAWKIRGALRTLGHVIAVLLMMPLVLSLGFFDLWFDFRGKLRQS